jgi:transcriptional regulator with XRE-family HTH domain
MAGGLEDFGSRVREARESRGWSQHELAAAAGMHQRQISYVERGERDLRLTTLLRLLSALELPASDLLDDVRH